MIMMELSVISSYQRLLALHTPHTSRRMLNNNVSIAHLDVVDSQCMQT